MSEGGVLTVRNLGLTNQLTCNVKLASKDKVMQVKALWDTGATTSCISQQVVDGLGLDSPDVGHIMGVFSKQFENVEEYTLSIALTDKIVLPDCRVSKVPIDRQRIDMIIGMNVIGLGDFAVSNFDGNTVFTFRFPPSEKPM